LINAALVGIDFGKFDFEASLEELSLLAQSAGANPAVTLTGRRSSPDAKMFVGSGKVEELRLACEANDVELVIFNHALAPAQQRNLEVALNRRVVDRTSLILDIFAQRARSHEGKLQVELAQLQYLSTRLIRAWTHLERQKGGIGLRGPGETQLETDRRLIGERIKALKTRLEKLRRQHGTQRRQRVRNRTMSVSLVGYTNAGKSSILRSLAGAPEVFVEDRLFATLDPLTREAELGEGQKVLVTDTVGFIRKLPHDLVASFRATLEEVKEADLLLHVIDASHHLWEDQARVVAQVLEELGAADRPMLTVFNKMDRVEEELVPALHARAKDIAPDSVFVSAITEDGLEPLRRALLAAVRKLKPVTELRVSTSNGKLLAELHRTGEVLDQRHDGEDMVVRVRADAATLGRLRAAGAKG
jgi:GTP-binding protein HflX